MFRLITSIVLLAAFTLSVFGSTVTVAPGKPEPQHVRWKDRSIRIAVSSSLTKPNANIKSDSDVIGAVRRSLQAWQSAADIEFQLDTSDRQNVSPAGISGDGISLITIAPSPENVLFFARDGQTASAKTRVFYNRKGFITEADIVLNPFQQFSTDGTYGTFDLQSALTHEIGHMLGLRHSGVMGSAMSENLAKNDALGQGEFAPRGLSESDIAAVRELYGAGKDADSCCSAITGRLSLPATRTGRNIKIWAEESETGRVIAQTDTNVDGSFRIGGLVAGTYDLFWKTRDHLAPSGGELGPVQVEKSETKVLSQKITLEPNKFVLDYVGVNSQLAESGISIESGSEQTIYLGGKGLDSKDVTIDFGSPFLHAVPGSLADQDFGEGVSVVKIVIQVDAGAPPGVYSIFATGRDGSRAVLIGALRVE